MQVRGVRQRHGVMEGVAGRQVFVHIITGGGKHGTMLARLPGDMYIAKKDT